MKVKLKLEKLFYGDIVGKTWEETKEKYLREVGEIQMKKKQN